MVTGNSGNAGNSGYLVGYPAQNAFLGKIQVSAYQFHFGLQINFTDYTYHYW